MTKLTPKQKAKNAIKWIDNLPSYKQAPPALRGILGNAEYGFCCLGAGCEILNMDYIQSGAESGELKHSVGLLNRWGGFTVGNKYYKASDLTILNDSTNAGFKRIANLMKTKPNWMFKPEVAELIEEHYRSFDHA